MWVVKTKHNMNTTTKNEIINNLIKMITSKVAGLVAQGMPEQDAFNAIMQRLEAESPSVFAFLVSSTRF